MIVRVEVLLQSSCRQGVGFFLYMPGRLQHFWAYLRNIVAPIGEILSVIKGLSIILSSGLDLADLGSVSQLRSVSGLGSRLGLVRRGITLAILIEDNVRDD